MSVGSNSPKTRLEFLNVSPLSQRVESPLDFLNADLRAAGHLDPQLLDGVAVPFDQERPKDPHLDAFERLSHVPKIRRRSWVLVKGGCPEMFAPCTGRVHAPIDRRSDLRDTLAPRLLRRLRLNPLEAPKAALASSISGKAAYARFSPRLVTVVALRKARSDTHGRRPLRGWSAHRG
jgi:hypothetical protein